MGMRRWTFAQFFSLVLVFIYFSSLSANAAIARNLREGDTGAEVQELQKILNRDPDTRVAAIGPGSPGNETLYFGVRTKAAVMKLQQKYAAKILTPAGLTAPTGFVGIYTRALLENLDLGGVSLVPPPPTVLPPEPQKPTILSTTPTVITRVSQEITITGSNFSSTGNTVLASSEPANAFINIPSADGKTINFTFYFSAGDSLKKEMSEAAAAASLSYAAIAEAISGNIKLSVNGAKVTRVPVRIAVKNANGESAVQTLFVDMPSLLQN